MSRFNPHFPNAAQVFDAADKFKQRCLLSQESLFLDGQTLWTAEHFQALIDNYVKQPDVGDGGFYDKLASQLATCQALDVALMVEVFWIVQLGPTNLRAPTKAKTLERIWNMKPAAPFPTTSPFLATPVLSGLGSAGPGYNQYLWMEIVFAVEAFAAFVAKPRSEREALLNDAQGFALWLDSVPAGKGRQLYHTLCHVLFPDAFERRRKIFSTGCQPDWTEQGSRHAGQRGGCYITARSAIYRRAVACCRNDACTHSRARAMEVAAGAGSARYQSYGAVRMAAG